MLSFLHHLSGFFFYSIGLSFFLTYVLFRNNVGGTFPEWWLQIGDLPMLLVAILYGGLSLTFSFRTSKSVPRSFLFVIMLPLLSLFVLFTILNFWGVVPNS